MHTFLSLALKLGGSAHALSSIRPIKTDSGNTAPVTEETEAWEIRSQGKAMTAKM